VRFPDFLDDCAAAVRSAIEQAAAQGGDPGKIFLMGHSAGGYNAAMLALDAQFLKRARVDPRVLRGFIGLAGPYDFLPLQSTVTRAIFGYPDTPLITQPIQHVSRAAPPVLLLAPEQDDVVDPGNMPRLAAQPG